MKMSVIFLTYFLYSAIALKVNFDGNTDDNTKCQKQPVPQTECGANDRFSNEELKAMLPEFAKDWAKRPGNKKTFKLGANHQFAEYFLVKTLKPSAIVESGVLNGGATWGLRTAAGPDTPIFSFDPQDRVDQGFRDKNPKTQYFLGDKWKDITLADWDTLIPKEKRGDALVILDDHQIFYDRFKSLKELGFRHVFVEDNNKYGNGNTPPNFFCTKSELYKSAATNPYAKWGIMDAFYNSPWGNITEAKKAGVHAARPLQERTLTWEEHEKNAQWVRENMKAYFEFPAIHDVCQKRDTDLLKTAEELGNVGLSKNTGDPYVYDHRYPPYVEIKQD